MSSSLVSHQGNPAVAIAEDPELQRPKRMPGHVFPVKLDSQARGAGQVHAAGFQPRPRLLYFVEPGAQAAVFQNQKIRHRGAGVQARCHGYRPVRIVRGDLHVVDFRPGCDAQQFSDASAMLNVGLDHVHRALFHPFAESPASHDPLSGGHVHARERAPQFHHLPRRIGVDGLFDKQQVELAQAVG